MSKKIENNQGLNLLICFEIISYNVQFVQNKKYNIKTRILQQDDYVLRKSSDRNRRRFEPAAVRNVQKHF